MHRAFAGIHRSDDRANNLIWPSSHELGTKAGKDSANHAADVTEL